MNRHIKAISARTMEVLTSYAWPGNVRELQNFIERAVILTPGTSLRAPLEELTHVTIQRSQPQLPTLEEMEREHVLRALKESNWVTGSPKRRGEQAWHETDHPGLSDS
jgi:formate hydrogenlyase transcriptional activator